ncbi:hypothetical protein [Gandjariella thermophila]|uniref:Gram-positive cocci surface proteins LPxTG domain-containing protein n=1 Tax=Gandjariella thermophila TaxID=1931992 RepID=A0A4D4JH67_9PSEU|nr:hypothetical protein [Gandjariella thermophila]GDY33237.1 hypothetical protein GTS_48700 [Gandjariella thermophila]
MKRPRRRSWRRAVAAGACALAFGLAGAPNAAAAEVNATPVAPTTAAPEGSRPDVAQSDTPVRSTAVGVSALVLGIGGFAFGIARRARASARADDR